MLPDISSVETKCSYQPNSTLIYRLCRAFVERGFAGGELWNQAAGHPLAFAKAAIETLLSQVWDSKLDEWVTYSFQVQDDPDRDDPRHPAVRGKLYAMVDTQMSGYLVIGSLLDRLEEIHAGLGAAFYSVLDRSLARWIRVYSYTDAQYYEENLREMLENDDPDNAEAYEFPQVEAAIPAYLRNHDVPTYACRRLLRHFQAHPFCGRWIETLLRIHRISRLRVVHEQIHSYYDDPPLPSLLIVFQQHDGIEASFDAESQYFYETSHEPTFAVPFMVDEPRQCDAALRSIAAFFRLNSELFRLIEELQTWREKHAGGHQHRAESPV